VPFAERESVRVLYVDDDAISRRVLVRVLERAGFVCDACTGADESYALVRQRSYAVIVADHRLRRGDGLSLLRQLHAVQPLATLVLATAREQRLEIAGGQLPYEFLPKPYDTDALLAVMDRAVQSYEARTGLGDAALAAAPVLLLSEDRSEAERTSQGISLRTEGKVRVAIARSLTHALDALFAVRFSAALVDMSSSPTGGETASIETVEELLRRAPHLPIVVLTGSDDAQLKRGVLRAGALDYLSKRGVSFELIVHALRCAVERGAREARLRALEREDTMTGAVNRAVLRDEMARLIAAAMPFSVTVCDVRDLPVVNQQHGHFAGDVVLAATVARLKQELGSSATIGRLGGSTFAVVRRTSSGALPLQRMRDVLEAGFEFDDAALRPRIGFGVTHYPDHSATVSMLLHEAELGAHEDAAAYVPRLSSLPPPTLRPARVHVVMVDQDGASSAVAQVAVDAAGLRLRLSVVQSGDELRELLQRSPTRDSHVDLILLDLGLPAGEAYDILRALKADERTCAIPVVAMTGSDSDADSLSVAYTLQASSCIRRPADPDEFMRVLAALENYWFSLVELPSGQAGVRSYLAADG
jgi:diguanylate cyclase (GGDEF)-like protein